MHRLARNLTIAGTLCVAGAAAPLARAGGYDTPILYSAEHMGVGGAAIGYVDDPSAMFHNPAGLMGTKGLSLMANLTLVTGSIQSSPASTNPNEESESLLALAPLIGVSYDVNDVVAFGLAFYPVASAGAEYLYTDAGSQVATRNFTSVRFLEFSPGVAVKIPGTNLSIGAGYRFSIVQLGRYLGPEDKSEGAPTFDVSMSGKNFAGFRVGLQWQPIPELELGLVFRSLTRTEIEDDKGVVLAPATNIKTEFTLPAKAGFGVRANLDPIAIMLDVEYGFYSQNESNEFLADPALLLPIVNVSRWKDALTLRAGVEYGVDKRWFFRGGFLYDGQVSQQNFPSAFGTPPTSTSTITAGVGYKCGETWKLNFAVAQRFGNTKVVRATTDSEGNALPGCIPCSASGDYSLSMTAFYLDFMYAFPNL